MSCCCGHHHHCSCQGHHHCSCHERRHECSCHSESESPSRHGRRHGFLGREEYIARLDEERDILERRLRYVKEELDELRRGAQPKE